VYELSGGEQQRVALARSLAPGPRLLMLDEPLGSLDRALREELMKELPVILKRVGVTALYVTHDQQEAFAVADRVVIMERGRIVQQGTPRRVYRQPASPWVARFLGLNNLLPGQIVVAEGGRLWVETAIGRLAVVNAEGEPSSMVEGEQVTVLIRPEAARLADQCPAEGAMPISGRVRESSFRGGYCHLVVQCEQAPARELAFDLALSSGDLPGPGEAIRLTVQPEAISLLPVMEGRDG
jgi:ABC-type Fe3+/spermidine/putrescine transport system ATPase subunit